MRETTLQTPKSVQKEGRRWSMHQSRSSPAACGTDHGGAVCALQPWRSPVEQISTCNSGRSVVEQMSTCSTWKSVVEQISTCSSGRSVMEQISTCSSQRSMVEPIFPCSPWRSVVEQNFTRGPGRTPHLHLPMAGTCSASEGWFGTQTAARSLPG